MKSFIGGVKEFFVALREFDGFAWIMVGLVGLLVVVMFLAATTETQDEKDIRELQQRVEALERGVCI